MKKAIKLVLIYFGMQILGGMTAIPLAMIYMYATEGALDPNRVSGMVMAPCMLLGFVYMAFYLWKKNYLTGDALLYRPTTLSVLAATLVGGFSLAMLMDVVITWLHLPNLMEETFDALQSGWLGILCVSVLGPVLEEWLFRAAITKELLRRYRPATAIVLSGLVFGIFHVNPVQVVNAAFLGFFLAWVYYKTRSLVPCILLHILNNSFSVWFSLRYPDVETTEELMGHSVHLACLAACVLLLAASIAVLMRQRTPAEPLLTEEQR